MLRREVQGQKMATVWTPREIEVIRLVASGMRNKEIAHKLAIAEGAVKIHLHRPYKNSTSTAA